MIRVVMRKVAERLLADVHRRVRKLEESIALVEGKVAAAEQER